MQQNCIMKKYGENEAIQFQNPMEHEINYLICPEHGTINNLSCLKPRGENYSIQNILKF